MTYLESQKLPDIFIGSENRTEVRDCFDIDLVEEMGPEMDQAAYSDLAQMVIGL